MRKLFAFIAPLVACSAFAVSPRYWTVTSTDEFLAGESEGVAISSRGELTAAPTARRVASFTDPFVLSQVTDDAGTRYFGTGNSGKLYRLNGTQVEAVWTAPEPEIYALAASGSSLLVGTSPNGKVYRVDRSGKSSVVFDPKQAYIWAIQPLSNGSFLVATGVEGKIFRVDANGAGTVWFDAPETHIRSLALASNGRVLAGGSGEGRIYDLDAQGKGRAIFDSPLTEISAIYFDAKSGEAWAGGVSNTLPTAPPQPKGDQTKQAAAADAKKSDAAAGGEGGGVEVSFSFDDGASSAGGPTAGGELYRIASDGYVETVRKFDREVIYAITGGNDGALLIATGPNGRLYELRDRDIALLASVPEKQVVTVRAAGGSYEITTTNSGALYRLESGASTKSEFRSAVKDAERFSTFGQYEVRGSNVDRGIVMAFRSGMTSTPDENWSEWKDVSGATGAAAAPPARYVQWRLRFDNAAANARVDAVTLAYLNRNIAPIVDSISVLEPSAVLVSGAYPSSPQVLEATNPDEYGIFTSLDSPRERAAADQGKKLYRKGFRTISWKARDENSDSLRYDVAFRRKGDSPWLRLRSNIEESQLNFDTSQLPDGTYEVRVTATDAPDNPDRPLSGSREGTEFIVDNTAPTISSSREGDALVVRVSDTASPVGRVEYSVNAEKWIRIMPVDGISDSRDERYRIPAPASGSYVVVRAVDTFANVTTEQLR